MAWLRDLIENCPSLLPLFPRRGMIQQKLTPTNVQYHYLSQLVPQHLRFHRPASHFSVSNFSPIAYPATSSGTHLISLGAEKYWYSLIPGTSILSILRGYHVRSGRKSVIARSPFPRLDRFWFLGCIDFPHSVGRFLGFGVSIMADKTEAPMLEALTASKKTTPIQPSKRYVGQRTAVELKKVQKDTGGIEVDAIQRESISISISSFLLKIIRAHFCVFFFPHLFFNPLLTVPTRH